MGFKGGFDSSWQDKWPSSVGDDNKRFSSLRSSTNNNQPNVADAKTNNAAASIVGDKKPQKAGPKARKPIDLGAAANFAQQSTQHSTRQAKSLKKLDPKPENRLILVLLQTLPNNLLNILLAKQKASKSWTQSQKTD